MYIIIFITSLFMKQKSLEWHKSIELTKYELGIILENFILHIFLLPIFLGFTFSFNKCVLHIRTVFKKNLLIWSYLPNNLPYSVSYKVERTEKFIFFMGK